MSLFTWFRNTLSLASSFQKFPIRPRAYFATSIPSATHSCTIPMTDIRVGYEAELMEQEFPAAEPRRVMEARGWRVRDPTWRKMSGTPDAVQASAALFSRYQDWQNSERRSKLPTGLTIAVVKPSVVPRYYKGALDEIGATCLNSIIMMRSKGGRTIQFHCADRSPLAH